MSDVNSCFRVITVNSCSCYNGRDNTDCFQPKPIEFSATLAFVEIDQPASSSFVVLIFPHWLYAFLLIHHCALHFATQQSYNSEIIILIWSPSHSNTSNLLYVYTTNQSPKLSYIRNIFNVKKQPPLIQVCVCSFFMAHQDTKGHSVP